MKAPRSSRLLNLRQSAYQTEGLKFRLDESSVAGQPQQARRTLEQFEGSAPGALAQDGEHDYQNSTCRLSL